MLFILFIFNYLNNLFYLSYIPRLYTDTLNHTEHENQMKFDLIHVYFQLVIL